MLLILNVLPPLLVLVPLGAGAAFSNSCNVTHYPNSTTYLLKETMETCDGYNWLINGTVVANEDSFNRTLVQSREWNNITVLSCFDTVTYRNVCKPNTVNCLYTCPLTPPSDEHSSPHAERHGVAIGGSICICLFVISCGLLIWCNKEYLKKKRQAWCRRSYSPVQQPVPI